MGCDGAGALAAAGAGGPSWRRGGREGGATPCNVLFDSLISSIQFFLSFSLGSIDVWMEEESIWIWIDVVVLIYSRFGPLHFAYRFGKSLV